MPPEAAQQTAPEFTQHPPADPRPLPKSLLVFLLILLASVGISLLSARLDLPHTDAQPGFERLFPHPVAFDYMDYEWRFRLRHSVQFFTAPGFPWYYPAPAIFIHYPFYITPVGHRIYDATVTLLTVLTALGFALALHRAGLRRLTALAVAGFTAALSWPIYFAAQRGNIEAITWLLAAAAIWAYAAGADISAALLIGVAGSIKLYPILFVVLFLQKRRFGLAAISLVTAAILTLLGLRFLEPDALDAFHRTLAGIHRWTVDNSETIFPGVAGYDHSLFGLVKAITQPLHPDFHRELTVYYPVAGLTAALVYLLRVTRQPELNQVLFLCCAMVTLPPTSYDYTLSLLYIPFAWLAVLAVRSSPQTPSLPGTVPLLPGTRANPLANTQVPRTRYAAIVLLAFCLAPDTYLWFNHAPSLPGVFRAICLLGLMLLATLHPLTTRDPAPQPRLAL